MSPGRARLYRIVFVISLVLLAAGMLLGLYEVVYKRQKLPSLVFQNIAEIEQLIDAEQYDEAISRLNMTLALFSADQQLTHNMLGNVYNARGDREAAIRHYRRALEYDPLFAEAYNNLGVALARTDRRVDAMVELVRAIELRPGYDEAYNNLARVVASYDRNSRPAETAPPAVTAARGHLAAAGRAIAVPDSPVVPRPADSAVLRRARRYLGQLHAGELESFRQRFTVDFASRTSAQDLAGLTQRLDDELGDELEILTERVIKRAEYDVYLRVSRFEKADQLVEWSLVLDESGAIADIRIRLGITR
jgi:tetratricopeptide (TPR) repeat protein